MTPDRYTALDLSWTEAQYQRAAKNWCIRTAEQHRRAERWKVAALALAVVCALAWRRK